MFEEIKNIKTDRKSLRSFGITFGVILLIIAGFLFFKEIESYTVFIYVSLIFSLSGLIIPTILKPIYLLWMVFAVILGWFMTRLILMLLYYIIITPIGVVSRLFGKNFLNLSRSNKDSYWNQRISHIELGQDYEKQF